MTHVFLTHRNIRRDSEDVPKSSRLLLSNKKTARLSTNATNVVTWATESTHKVDVELGHSESRKHSTYLRKIRLHPRQMSYDP